MKRRAISILILALLATGCGKAQSHTPHKTSGDVQYIASVNSSVFHHVNCPSARKIATENLETYSTRAEATDDGKRACKRCKP